VELADILVLVEKEEIIFVLLMVVQEQAVQVAEVHMEEYLEMAAAGAVVLDYLD
jgi:hypothetical protein